MTVPSFPSDLVVDAPATGWASPARAPGAAGQRATAGDRTRWAAGALSFWPLQLLGWGAFAVAMAGSRVGRFPLTYMVVSKGALALLGLAVTSALMRPLYARWLAPTFPAVSPDAPRPVRTIAVATLVSYAAALLWTAAYAVADVPIQRALLRPDARLGGAWALVAGSLYHAFVLLAWSVLYVGLKHQQLLQDAHARALRAEALAQAARLEALRYQLNPHFLFNALNAVSTLVLDERPREATAMLARVAELLRASLDPALGDEVPLDVELALARRYLEVEGVRLGDRLRPEFDVDPGAHGALVPRLLLQPVVENAVRHAVARHPAGGRVAVRARRVGDRLRVVVDDDGPGPAGDAPPPREGHGIGLANVRDRLAARHGVAGEVAVEQSPSGGRRVCLTLPYVEATHAAPGAGPGAMGRA